LFIDSHAHLDSEAFDADREAVIERAHGVGVSEMIVVGASDGIESARRAVKLADPEAGLYATIGVHPHDVAEMNDDWVSEIARLAGLPQVVGIGETGLDYHYDHSPRQDQMHWFGHFADLALELDLPLVCHIRDAHKEARSLLQPLCASGLRGVIHCFTGNSEDARNYVEMGLFVSFSGIATFKKSAEIRAAARLIPSDRILVETDCPYLAPVPKRGQRNEPAFLAHTAALLAHERGVELAEFAQQATANTRILFALTAHSHASI